MATNDSMIQVKDLKKHYKMGTIRALDGVTVNINKGDVMAVIGPSGSGKSTFLRSLNLLEEPTGGAIIFSGVDITKKKYQDENGKTVKLDIDALRQRMGMVFQHFNLFPHMTILENMSLADNKGNFYGLGKGINKNRKSYYQELLSQLNLGLENKLNVKVGSLSGGQRQAMALLMSTMTPIEFLILDEHTAALDPKTAAKVLETTDKIVNSEHLTTLMITHNMRDAIAHGNRLIMMNAGHVIYDVAGEEKKHLTVQDLLAKFEEAAGGELANDRMILS